MMINDWLILLVLVILVCLDSVMLYSRSRGLAAYAWRKLPVVNISITLFVVVGIVMKAMQSL